MDGDKARIAAGTVVIVALSGLIIVFLAPASAQEGKAEAKVEYVGRDFRDPLELPPALRRPEEVPVVEGVEVKLPDLTVEGIVWGTDRPQAIIDGEVLERGDTITGARILDIKKDGVTLLYKNRRFIIRPLIEGRSIGR